MTLDWMDETRRWYLHEWIKYKVYPHGSFVVDFYDQLAKVPATTTCST